MLSTPLGTLSVYLDGDEIDYQIKKLPLEFPFCDLSGRYAIFIHLEPDGQEHDLACCINGYKPNAEDDIETGENFESKSFYCKGTKLTIGMVGDTDYVDGERINDAFTYDTDFLENGVSYLVLEDTETSDYVFGVAWIENVTSETEVQTWFGADPSLLF